jgi:hypothetical protein
MGCESDPDPVGQDQSVARDQGTELGQQPEVGPGQDGGIDAGDAAVDQVSPDLGPDAALVIEQIYLDKVMGEAALVVGPDGTSVLIDTGGSAHTKQVLEAVDRRLGQRTVDWVIITHFHYDHVGGFANLVTPSTGNGNKPLVVKQGVISRGLYDLGDVAETTPTFQAYCQEIAKPQWKANHMLIDLCTGPAKAPCDGQGTGDPWPASGCPNLLLGDMTDPGDDGQGKLSYIDLGGGARLTLYHANGHVATGSGVKSAESAGITIGHGGTAPENGRSLGGVIRWGSFLYTFHGDLTGTVEALIVKLQKEVTASPGGPLLVKDGDLDVAHLSHHGLEGSTSQEWVDWLLPADGADRNAVIGANGMYVLSPAPGVLSRVGDRVGQGYIWLTMPAALGGKHPRLKTAYGAVVVRALSGGASYEVFIRDASGPKPAESYTSN